MTHQDFYNRRKLLRLKDYDYTLPGPYYITICTQDKINFFGHIREGKMILSPAGKMVDSVWLAMPDHYPGVILDQHVIMPDHMHGIVFLNIDADFEPHNGKMLSLPDLVHRFKSFTTARYRHGVYEQGWSRFPGRLWQRNYHEEIIRSEEQLNRKREYLSNNPLQWWLKMQNEMQLKEIKRTKKPRGYPNRI